MAGAAHNILVLERLTLILLLNSQQHLATTDSAVASQPDAPDQLAPLLAWINANLNRPLALEDLEAQWCCSKRNLQYLFRQHLQCTPMQWVKQQRLKRALDRLQNPRPNDTVRAIATACGYGNQAAFSRDFRAWHQRRPSDVLRSSRISAMGCVTDATGQSTLNSNAG